MFKLVPVVEIDTARMNPGMWHTIVTFSGVLELEMLVTLGRVTIRQWNDDKLEWVVIAKFYLDGRSNDD